MRTLLVRTSPSPAWRAAEVIQEGASLVVRHTDGSAADDGAYDLSQSCLALHDVPDGPADAVRTSIGLRTGDDRSVHFLARTEDELGRCVFPLGLSHPHTHRRWIAATAPKALEVRRPDRVMSKLRSLRDGPPSSGGGPPAATGWRRRTAARAPAASPPLPPPPPPARSTAAPRRPPADRLAAMRRLFADRPDEELSRFLLARDCNVGAAAALLRRRIEWCSTFPLPIDPESCGGELAAGRCVVRGRDREGRPIVYFYVWAQDPLGRVFADMVRSIVYRVEEAIGLLPDATGKICFVLWREETMSNKHFDWELVRAIAALLQAHYPERLGSALVFPAGPLISMIHQIAGMLVDATTMDKVRLIKRAAGFDEFVAPDQLISALGGEDEFEFDPALDAVGGVDRPVTARGGSEANRARSRVPLAWIYPKPDLVLAEPRRLASAPSAELPAVPPPVDDGGGDDNDDGKAPPPPLGEERPLPAAPSQPTSFVRVPIAAGASFSTTVKVAAGEVLSWDFGTLDFDVSFGVDFVPVGIVAKEDGSFDSIAVVPPARVDSHIWNIAGSRAALLSGTFTLRWDNAYSLVRGKTLFYRTTTTSPNGGAATDLIRTEVPAGAALIERLTVHAGDVVGWRFATVDFDIEFDVVLHVADGQEGGGSSDDDSDSARVLVPQTRVASHEALQVGECVLPLSGTLQLCWSNRYAYLGSKALLHATTGGAGPGVREVTTGP